jgi:glycosyltransferase involved in cell wall biosynthesis
MYSSDPTDNPRPAVRMLLHSAFHHDARVLREASSLVGAGYSVDIVAGDDPLRPDPLPRREIVEGAAVVRVTRDSRTARLGRRVAAALRARRGEPSAAAPASASAPASPLTGGAYRTATRAVKTLDYARYVRSALRQLRPGGPAVFVAHDLITLPVGWLAKRRHGGRLVYDSHELYTEHDAGALGGRLARRRWRALESRLIRDADHVITVCDSIADELARRYGVPRPTVIRNVPRRPGEFVPGLDLRERLGIPPELALVLYLGGLTRNRGLEQLIEAAELLPECAVVMLGPSAPDYSGRLEGLVARHGLGHRVHVLGPVEPDRVIGTAGSADVGVTFIQNVGLNNYFSLPNKLFEYVHAGLPVVTSAFPELERVVLGCDIGVTCDPADPATIARAIGELLHDGERRARMSANARAAATDLSWEAEGRRYVGLFDELVAASGPGG